MLQKQYYQPFRQSSPSTKLGHSSDFSLGRVINPEVTFFGVNTGPMGNSNPSDSGTREPKTVRVDLGCLAKQADGDVLAFFELFEARCKDVMIDEAVFIEIIDLASATGELVSAFNSIAHQDLKLEIISKIDEFRKFGELCFPIFNVSVAL